jgi:hypothetical protein
LFFLQAMVKELLLLLLLLEGIEKDRRRDY